MWMVQWQTVKNDFLSTAACISLSLLFVFQSYKIINFAPTLLQIIVSEQVEFPVRQAGKTSKTVQVIFWLIVF